MLLGLEYILFYSIGIVTFFIFLSRYPELIKIFNEVVYDALRILSLSLILTFFGITLSCAHLHIIEKDDAREILVYGLQCAIFWSILVILNLVTIKSYEIIKSPLTFKLLKSIELTLLLHFAILFTFLFFVLIRVLKV